MTCLHRAIRNRLCMALACCALILITGPASIAQEASINPCLMTLNQNIAACANAEMTRPGRNPSDFSFWMTCKAKHQPEYDRCVGQMTQQNDAQCAEARENIDWVLDRDAGAQGTYRRNRAGGKSPLDAILAAQAHNPAAQRSIRACQMWAETYLAGKLSGDKTGGALANTYADLCSRNAGNAQLQAVLGCVVLRDDPKGSREEIDQVSREACGRMAQVCEARPTAALLDTYRRASDALSCNTRYGSGCGGRNPFPQVVLNAGGDPRQPDGNANPESGGTGAGEASGVAGSSGPRANSPQDTAACVSRLRQQRLGMMQNAEQSGVNPQLMAALRAERLVQLDCQTSPPGGINQQTAQTAAGRTYACAVQALTVAIAAARQGMECTAAQNAGLAQYPVPPVPGTQAAPRPNVGTTSPSGPVGIDASKSGVSGRF